MFTNTNFDASYRRREMYGHLCSYSSCYAAARMNIIYETTKERGATILIPTAMVDAMNPGGAMGIVAAARPLPA